MSSLVVFCGLDCAQCEAYQATQANDPAWQERILIRWRAEYNAPEMSLNDITCDGCRGPRLGGYCGACPIRACAVGRGLQTCADCPEYACAELEKFFTMAPHAHEMLELLRVRN